MCRYAMTTYKPHYACFECRKTFKRKLLSDVRKGVKEAVEAKCPDCGNITADMGLDFESPKKADLKSWEHIKNLFTVGVTFHSCGCSGPGYIPNTDEKLLVFLTDKKKKYIANLQFWLNRKEAVSKKEIEKDANEAFAYAGQIPFQMRAKKGYVSPQTAIAYWNEKLFELEENITYLKTKPKSKFKS